MHEYYNGFLTLWHEKNNSMILDTVDSAIHSQVLKFQKESHTS